MNRLSIFNKFDRELHKGFHEYNGVELNPKETELLMVIEDNPSKPMRYYGGVIGLEKGSFTYLSELLETKGLIKRINNETDRRSKVLELTEKGRRMVLKLDQLYNEYLERRFACFTAEELQKLFHATELVEHLTIKLENSSGETRK